MNRFEISGATGVDCFEECPVFQHIGQPSEYRTGLTSNISSWAS